MSQLKLQQVFAALITAKSEPEKGLSKHLKNWNILDCAEMGCWKDLSLLTRCKSFGGLF